MLIIIKLGDENGKHVFPLWDVSVGNCVVNLSVAGGQWYPLQCFLWWKSLENMFPHYISSVSVGNPVRKFVTVGNIKPSQSEHFLKLYSSISHLLGWYLSFDFPFKGFKLRYLIPFIVLGLKSLSSDGCLTHKDLLLLAALCCSQATQHKPPCTQLLSLTTPFNAVVKHPKLFFYHSRNPTESLFLSLSIHLWLFAPASFLNSWFA